MVAGAEAPAYTFVNLLRLSGFPVGASFRARDQAAEETKADPACLIEGDTQVLQNDVESRICQVRQIWTTTCWCISGIFAHMLWFEDGVAGGFWAGADSEGGLLAP